MAKQNSNNTGKGSNTNSKTTDSKEKGETMKIETKLKTKTQKALTTLNNHLLKTPGLILNVAGPFAELHTACNGDTKKWSKALNDNFKNLPDKRELNYYRKLGTMMELSDYGVAKYLKEKHPNVVNVRTMWEKYREGCASEVKAHDETRLEAHVKAGKDKADFKPWAIVKKKTTNSGNSDNSGNGDDTPTIDIDKADLQTAIAHAHASFNRINSLLNVSKRTDISNKDVNALKVLFKLVHNAHTTTVDELKINMVG